MHLWDPAHTDWYPYLAGQMEIGMGDVKGMARRFDLATYRAEAAGWNVEKLVNVAAATGRHSIAETLEMERTPRPRPTPSSAGSGRPTRSAAAIAGIDEQMEASRFRGVRPMGPHEGPLPDADVLRALEERDLVFEILARPTSSRPPRRDSSVTRTWWWSSSTSGGPGRPTTRSARSGRRACEALAAVGPNVHCKLSGLAMPVGSMDAAAFAPWLEPMIERFGVDRCFFASNFPVDGLHGTLDALVVRLRRGHREPRRRRPASSSSPPTPSACTAAEHRHRS